MERIFLWGGEVSMIESNDDQFLSQVKKEIARVESLQREDENFGDANLREIHGAGYEPDSSIVVFEDNG